MSRSFLRALSGALLLFVCLALPAGADETPNLAARLRAELADGSITADDALTIATVAIMNPRLLPEPYNLERDRCGTELLAIIAETAPKASDEVRAGVKYLMSPPNRREKLLRPSMKSRSLDGKATLLQQAIDQIWGPSATNTVLTPHFRIIWTNSGPDGTSAANVNRIADFLEIAYANYAGHGFTMPAAPNDGKIDVIVREDVCPFPGLDCASGTAIPGDLSDFHNGDGDPLIILTNASLVVDALRTLTAHELFHLVQYEKMGLFTLLANRWVLEGMATSMEDVVWPGANRYFDEVAEFYDFINQSITLRTYDAVLFWKYLMMNHSGNNPSILRDLLAAMGATNVYDGLKNTLVGRGSTLDFAMHHFALWNLLVNHRFQPGYYDDASNPLWPAMNNFMDQHSLGAVKTVPTNIEHLAGLSARYFRITPDSTITSSRKLTVKAHGDPFGHVRGWAVHRRTNNTVDIRDLNLQGGGTASTVFNDFSSSTAEVVIILTNGFEGIEQTGDYSASLPTSIDLAFAMDTTGSMGGSISALKSTATSAMQTLGSNGADFRIAITEFKDFPVSPYGGPGDYPYRANSPFSSTPSVIVGGINMLAASGGGNIPESMLSGVMGCINGQGIGAWRSGSNKAIVIMTDAPEHNPEPFTGYTRAGVIAAALAGGINVPLGGPGAVALSSESVAAATAETPIKLYGVAVGGSFSAFNSLSQLANGTGGKVFTTSTNPTDIANAILAAIGEISDGGGNPPPPPPPTNHPPNVSGALADPSQLWTPNNKMVDVRIHNVTDPDGDGVTVRITAVTQDEPVNDSNSGKGQPDASGVGTATAQVRAERDGDGNGRVYRIAFTATDSRGASSSGSVTVCVPHDQGQNTVCTDDGQSFTSTNP